MMRSMFTGVAGLRTHQMKMDVIGNNIANVNTVGFKSSTVTFKELFYQSMQGASAPNADTGRGGTNPLQVGLGVAVGSIDNNMSQGAAQTTDNPLDMMIDGNAFFIVNDGTSNYFTRAGAFRLDVDGNLVTPGGLKVQGWPATADGKNIERVTKVQNLTIKSPANMRITSVPTTTASFEGNMNMAEGTLPPDGTGEGILKTIDFYDTLGNYYRLDYLFTYDPDPAVMEWTMTPVTENDPETGNPVSVTLRKNQKDTVVVNVADYEFPIVTFSFHEDGTFNQITSQTSTPPVTLGPDYPPYLFQIPPMDGNILGINAETMSMEVNLGYVTQQESKTTIKGFYTNGGPPGDLIGFSVGQDGIIIGTYSNGQTKKLGQIAVASFKNPMGLEKIGDNLFTTTPNSGIFNDIGEDVTASGGTIGGSRLEMSNVDLSREFTEMITTQRGFQANSRVITTSDEMLQELVRLK